MSMHVKLKTKYIVNIITIWAIVLLTSVDSTIAQNYFETYKKEKTQHLEQKGDSLIKLSISQNCFDETAKIAHDLSIYFYRKDIFKSIVYGKIEIENLEKNKKITKEYINALYNVGRFFYKNHEYDNAIFYYEKVIKLNTDKIKVAKSYSEIGKCYNLKGDFFKAILHLRTGVKLMEKLPYTESLIVQYLNIVEVYRKIEDEDSLIKSILLLKKADSLSKTTTCLLYTSPSPRD